MNEAVDQVRRRENKGLRADGDDRLVGSKRLWLFRTENLPLDRYDVETRMDFADLKRSNLQTARAWKLKEMLRGLWKQPSRAAGARWYRRWYGSAVRSRLTPVKKVAAMVKRHLHNVLTYFKHRVTNAGSETINSVVQMLQKRAFGYRSFRNFRTAILFRCGELDLFVHSRFQATRKPDGPNRGTPRSIRPGRPGLMMGTRSPTATRSGPSRTRVPSRAPTDAVHGAPASQWSDI
jgi:hypothetical protein